MAWSAIAKTPQGEALPRGIYVSVTAIGLRKLTAVLVRWVDAPEWARCGDGLSVEIGDGKHAGQLRLARGGSYGLPYREKKGMPRVRLFITQFPGVPKPPIAAMLCYYETDGESVVITLPKWAGSVAEKPQPAAPDDRPKLADIVRAAAAKSAAAPKPPPRPIVTPLAARPAVQSLSHASGQEIVETAYAIRWGAERGIPGPKLDLSRVNAKRRQLGLPSFVVEG